MIPGTEPYGNDKGLRIVYSEMSYISRLWKACNVVNGDADTGINVKELNELCKNNT